MGEFSRLPPFLSPPFRPYLYEARNGSALATKELVSSFVCRKNTATPSNDGIMLVLRAHVIAPSFFAALLSLSLSFSLVLSPIYDSSPVAPSKYCLEPLVPIFARFPRGEPNILYFVKSVPTADFESFFCIVHVHAGCPVLIYKCNYLRNY